MELKTTYINPIVYRLRQLLLVEYYSARKYSKAADDRQPVLTLCYRSCVSVASHLIRVGV